VRARRAEGEEEEGSENRLGDGEEGKGKEDREVEEERNGRE